MSIDYNRNPHTALPEYLQDACNRFSSNMDENPVMEEIPKRKPRKVKKTFFRKVLDWIQQDEESEEDFNPVLFAIEAISFVMILVIFFLAIYFYLPEWMVI